MEEIERRKVVRMFLKGIQAYSRIDRAKQVLCKDKDYSDCCLLHSSIDEKEEGFITYESLLKFCKDMRQTFTETQVRYIFRMINRSGNGKILQDEFASTIYPDQNSSSPKSSRTQSFKSSDKSANTSAKVDFCIFLKTFYQEHFEMDQAIKPFQNSQFTVEQLFRLIGKEEMDSDCFDSEYVLQFIRSYTDLGNLWLIIEDRDVNVFKKVFCSEEGLSLMRFKEIVQSDNALSISSHTKAPQKLGGQKKPFGIEKERKFLVSGKNNLTFGIRSNNSQASPNFSGKNWNIAETAERGTEDTQNQPQSSSAINHQTDGSLFSKSRPFSGSSSEEKIRPSSSHAQNFQKKTFGNGENRPESPSKEEGESLLSYNFNPSTNEKRQRYFARCPDNALRRDNPFTHSLHPIKSERTIKYLQSEDDQIKFLDSALSSTHHHNNHQSSFKIEDQFGPEDFVDIPLHYPFSEKYLGINTPHRTDERKVYDVKVNCKLWPDIKTSKPQDPYEHILDKFKKVYQAKKQLFSHPSFGDRNSKSFGKVNSQDSQHNELPKRNLLNKVEAVLENMRDITHLACAAFSKLRLPIQDLFTLVKPKSSSQYIYRDEMFALLKDMGIEPLESAKDICFRMFDSDRDGMIGLTDFKKFFRPEENNLREIQRTKTERYYGSFDELDDEFKRFFSNLLYCFVKMGENLRLFKLAFAEAFGSSKGLTKGELKDKIQSLFTTTRGAQKEEITFLADQIYSL